MEHWIFHPDQEAKIVSSEEYETYLLNGWFDTPAKFPQKVDLKKSDEETFLEELNGSVPCETLQPKRRGRPPRIA